MEKMRELVVRAQKGGPPEQRAAFGQIVRLMQDMVFGYAYSIVGDFHLAEDASQEAFIAAFRHLASLQDPEAFPGWIRRIVQTTCGQMLRRKAPAAGAIEQAAQMRIAGEEPVQEAEKREMRSRVLEAVRSLPDSEREVTTLFYINGYSQADLAQFLEVPVTTIKSRLHASRERLRERMISMVADQLNAGKPGPEFSARLFNGINLDKWVLLSGKGNYEVRKGELVVCGRLHAEVGGMSWDDYRASVEVLVESDSSAGMELPFNVQLCPRGTSVYCQLVGNCIILACWDEASERHFTHLASRQTNVTVGAWHRFEIQVEDGGVAVYFDGCQVVHMSVPCGTRGMLGLVVNHGSDARVRVRNMRITFLKPTSQQLAELENDAGANWEEYKRQEVATGKRDSTDDNRL
jgi:RNA polymerase sigma factor (sigma-70 family)